jgi:hypothetical protein
VEVAENEAATRKQRVLVVASEGTVRARVDGGGEGRWSKEKEASEETGEEK